MKIDRIILRLSLALVAIACSLANPVWGQKGPPPANPQGPTINPLMPAGVQRGQTAELTVAGTQLLSPTGVSIGIPAKITIPTADKNGQDAGKFKVKIEVPADTPIGWYPFRVAHCAEAASEPARSLCVDDAARNSPSAPRSNHSKTTSQAIPVPCAVGGSVVAETADYYKITVKAGQQLSFDCQARRIGSAIDAQMSIYDAKSMRELAFDNDSPGCHTDPRISYTFKDAGDYLVEIKDVLNRGGPEFFYRIRIGDFPIASTAFPMAAKRGTKAKIGFAGPAVEGIAPVDVDVPSDPAISVIWVAPKSAAGLPGWPVPVIVSDHDEAVEQEPNNNVKEANRIAIPGGITGRFQKSDDVDFYLFSAKKGQKLAIEAQTLEYYSPTLVYMILRNPKTGAEIAKSNPAVAPPADQKIDFVAPDDGDFVLEVQHLHFAGGPSESYRITIRPPTNRLRCESGKRVGFEMRFSGRRRRGASRVQIVRKGYTGPIELSVFGEPALSGTASIKAGKNAGLLLLSAKPDVPMGAYQFRVLAKATVDGKEVVQTASAKASVVQAMNGLNYPPMHLQSFVALAVKEKAPFTLAIKMDPPEGIPGGKANVTITAIREKGFEDEITFTPPTGLPPTIPAPKTVAAIGKGKTETTFPLDLNAKTPLGEYFGLVNAKAKFMGKEVRTAAAPASHCCWCIGLRVRFAGRARGGVAQARRKGEGESDRDSQGRLQRLDRARFPRSARQRYRWQSSDPGRQERHRGRDQRRRQGRPRPHADGDRRRRGDRAQQSPERVTDFFGQCAEEMSIMNLLKGSKANHGLHRSHGSGGEQARAKPNPGAHHHEHRILQHRTARRNCRRHAVGQGRGNARDDDRGSGRPHGHSVACSSPTRPPASSSDLSQGDLFRLRVRVLPFALPLPSAQARQRDRPGRRQRARPRIVEASRSRNPVGDLRQPPSRRSTPSAVRIEFHCKFLRAALQIRNR